MAPAANVQAEITLADSVPIVPSVIVRVVSFQTSVATAFAALVASSDVPMALAAIASASMAPDAIATESTAPAVNVQAEITLADNVPIVPSVMVRVPAFHTSVAIASAADVASSDVPIALAAIATESTAPVANVQAEIAWQ